MNLEISKMLTISTAHITEETDKLLRDGEVDVCCFSLDDFGWLILSFGPDKDIPEDLQACLTFANRHGCDWLRMDCDAPVVEGLVVYDW